MMVFATDIKFMISKIIGKRNLFVRTLITDQCLFILELRVTFIQMDEARAHTHTRTKTFKIQENND